MRLRHHALFVIGGFGLGNSTRCAALIERLHAQGVTVDVATSSNGLWYLDGSRHIRNLHALEPIAYNGRAGRISVAGTLLRAPVLAAKLMRNAFRIWQLQKENTYSFIAVDSEYSAFLIKWLLPVPLVAINNVFYTFRAIEELGIRAKTSSLCLTHFIERVDSFIQGRFSDFRISPTLKPVLSEDANTLFCPPLVRSGFGGAPPRRGLSRALVVASGSALGVCQDTVKRLADCADIEQVKVVGLEGSSSGRIVYLGRQKDISSHVADSDFILTTGGFSTISEGIVSGRPLLLIPIPGHFEQHFNAGLVEGAGFGIVTHNERLKEDVGRLAALKTSPASLFQADGGEVAAKALLSFLGSRFIVSGRFAV